MPLSRVDPGNYDALLADKVDKVCKLMAPFDVPEPEVFASPPLGFRMRAEFRVWHDGDRLDYVMFRPEDRQTPVPIEDFPIACEAIQRLMPELIARLRVEPLLRRKLFQVEFLSTLAGDTLVTLIYHRRLEDDWEAIAVHRIAHGQPSQSVPFHPKRRVELADGRFVCGDHRDTASIQGAMYSGRRTAMAVLERFH